MAASAAQIGSDQLPDVHRRGHEADIRVWDYYDLVPEAGFASQFYGRMLSKLVVWVGVTDPNDPDAEPVPLTPDLLDPATITYDSEGNPSGGEAIAGAQQILEAWERVQDPGGGRSELQQKYGQVMFVSGDGYLICTFNPNPLAGGDLLERWEFLSNVEIGLRRTQTSVNGAVQQGVEVTRQRFRGGKKSEEEKLTIANPAAPEAGQCLLWRVWTPHPRNSGDPDAPLRRVMDMCEELILLAADTRATARSRIARGGLLYLPEELLDPPSDDEDDTPLPDEDPDSDPVMRQITRHMIASIRTEGHVSSYVPVILRGPGDQATNIKFIDFSGAQKDYAGSARRMEAIDRFAMGVDMPPEELKGLGDVNHWTGWLVDRKAWQAYGQPVAERMVRDLTTTYLWPAIRATRLEDGTAAAVDEKRFVLWYSAERVVGNPDRAADAKDAHDRGAISDKSLRDSLDFDDDDQPTEENPNNNPRVLLAVARIAAAGDTSAAPPTGDDPEEDVSDAGDQPSETTEAPPPEADQPQGALSAQEVLGMARMAMVQSRALAGTRIAQAMRQSRYPCTDCRNVPKDGLAAFVGVDTVSEIMPKRNLAELVDGGTETLSRQLQHHGWNAAAVAGLCATIERHAAETLFDADPEDLPAEVYWS
jgi:hypothetical protein